ncbi:pre-pilin like leader sequence [Pseudomonas sp. S25]|uniref:Pre-pilin like leader sequence n=1 Tax=Pseudomonas maioricensis TaxID=1766623 RepID=A0ABS9ZDQ8_9PSED|nr:prepilin-type N-terminal cleavage/methylation domain-containing protein [Pseudomonas sp. S25]MCI8208156.1 pre-pilin like leader sequence [Pseudomonas sp. S25]
MRAKGFTLIELMITIAIFGILLAIGAPFTKAWSDSAKQREAAGVLKQGISRAKATALRNPEGARDDVAAAALCRSGQTLKLFKMATSVDCTSSATPLWTAQLPSSVGVKVGGSDVSCVAFNSRGLPVAGGNACTTASIDVTAGSESTFNVPII